MTRGVAFVVSMVTEIDQRLSDGGFDPFGPSVAEQLRLWPLEAWEDLAEEIGLRAPDASTIREVVEFYRQRAGRFAA